MKRRSALSMAVFIGTLSLACGDDGTAPGGGATIEDLAGAWDATTFTFTNRLNSAQSVDLVAEGGGANLTVDSSGTYRLVLVDPARGPESRPSVRQPATPCIGAAPPDNEPAA